MPTIEQAKNMTCPLARGEVFSNCIANECMFWRQEVDYDVYGPATRYKNKGYCGQIKPQDGNYLKETE